jgi:hypothetical protein
MQELFDYLDYKNKIPLDKYLLKLEKISPLSEIKYLKYWKEIKRKCIEGQWAEHNGEYKWLPGVQWFYTNFWSIELKKKGSKSNSKVLGKPYLRDIEWIKGYVYSTARGFSGFENDEEFSCHRVLIQEDREFIIDSWKDSDDFKHIVPTLYRSNGELKEYKESLKYLYEYKSSNLGKPLYYNEAKNVIDIETRNIGKTFQTSAFCGHNYLLDGAVDYDNFLKDLSEGDIPSSQTLVSAIDAKYSSTLMTAIILGMDNIPGSVQAGPILYPSPLIKKYTGSTQPGKTAIQEYEEKVGGQWVTKGSKSKLHHRTFGESEFAANGTRPSFSVIDEVGFCHILEAILGQLAECTTVGSWKFGTIWMTGTGGDMEGGKTESAKKVFYDPISYDCLAFDDVFENSGNKIGFFVPAWMTFDKYRDEFGNVDRDRALGELLKKRELLKNAKSKKPLNDEMQQRPLKPSEAFLESGGNIFHRAELDEHIAFLETDRDGYIKGKAGSLVINESGHVIFKVDTGLRACGYPMEPKEDKNGAVVIWKEPHEVVGDGPIPYGVFIAGLDPYAQEASKTSVSLGSIQVFTRATINGQVFDEQVAEYTARPERMDDFYNNAMKLLMYYNAICLYENNFNGFYTHLRNNNKLHFLAKTPTVLKNNKVENVANTYGLRMHNVKGLTTGGLKDELEMYTRDWLYEDAGTGDGKLNLHHIYSIPLLKELKAYNGIINTDRAISLMLVRAQKLQMHRIVSQKKEEIKKSSWVNTAKFFKR